MAFSDHLRQRSAAIVERWQHSALAMYPAAASRAFQREQDPFANPVGHALRSGTRAVVEGLIEGRDAAEIASALDEIIKIRAVQEFQPSEAIAFIFSLKDVVRAELEGEEGTGTFCAEHPKGRSGKRCLSPFPEMAALERQIDFIALAAFDIYMRYRGQVCELRIREIKRCCAPVAARGDGR